MKDDQIFYILYKMIHLFPSCRQHHSYSGVEWLGHEARGASYLQTPGPQTHSQLQSQLQL